MHSGGFCLAQDACEALLQKGAPVLSDMACGGWAGMGLHALHEGSAADTRARRCYHQIAASRVYAIAAIAAIGICRLRCGRCRQETGYEADVFIYLHPTCLAACSSI